MAPTSALPVGLKSHESYETEHVHRVYENIAFHFSATRFKPWPVVERFLSNLPAGSVGLDVGCGNGKYLAVNKDVFLIGSDRSSSLIRLARDKKPQEVIVEDGLHLPHPDSRFDFAISIAVIHHFSSSERRIAAISSILSCMKRSCGEMPPGKVLIFVWALEQENSRRGWTEGDEQDVFVPWVMNNHSGGKKAANHAPNGNAKFNVGNQDLEEESKVITHQRYYHLYRKGELEADIKAANGIVNEAGYEKDNWWAICEPLG